MISKSRFHVVLMVSKRNKPNWWEYTASPNLLALKRYMSIVQVVSNVDWSEYNTWLCIILRNESKGIHIGMRRRSGLFEIMSLIIFWTCNSHMKIWTLFSFTKHMSSIVHLESDICDQVDMIGSYVFVEINGCRFVNIWLVKI